MSPRVAFVLSILGCFLLGGCQPRELSTSPPEEDRKPRSGSSRFVHSTASTEQPAADQSKAKIATIVDSLYSLPDEEAAYWIDDLLQNHRDLAERDQVMTAVFEETQLRPPMIRLPILLELARQDDGTTGLRTTIVAELRSLLEEDHGQSWPDWALAISEHLAVQEGLLPVSDAIPNGLE